MAGYLLPNKGQVAELLAYHAGLGSQSLLRQQAKLTGLYDLIGALRGIGNYHRTIADGARMRLKMPSSGGSEIGWEVPPGVDPSDGLNLEEAQLVFKAIPEYLERSKTLGADSKRRLAGDLLIDRAQSIASSLKTALERMDTELTGVLAQYAVHAKSLPALEQERWARDLLNIENAQLLVKRTGEKFWKQAQVGGFINNGGGK
jgi:hypothetical protein